MTSRSECGEIEQDKTSHENKAILWSTDEVANWLRSKHFHEYVDLLTVKHKIDGQVLLMITENDLRLPPISLSVLGDIKRLMICLNELKVLNNFSVTAPGPASNGCATQNHETRNHLDSTNSQEELDSLASELGGILRNFHPVSQQLKPEFLKLVISYLYMFFVFMLTAFVMVIVHDRVPDMDKYPPLPDIMLDNLPYIPWAFEACEATALVLSFIMTITLIFHKHRFIILRRMFALTGTVFMLRCVTMLITSLSVPGTHLQCEPKNYGNLYSKLERAIVIYSGFGMSLQGVRTCGDYMFSGHTVVVTMLNFFITEYTPRRIPMLHTLSWVCNIFAIFFILAAHEHYSIDVFVAFYIASRLFLYYHSLANNRVLSQQDNRTRIWFPMFSYFESSLNGLVPNEYENPLQALSAWFSRIKSKKQ